MDAPLSPNQLTKEGYFQLRQQLEFTPRAWPNLVVLLADVLLLSGAIWLAERSLQLTGMVSWTIYLASQLMMVIAFFHGFAVMHECGHGTCSRHPAINAVVGHLASLLCFLPYYPWKYIHAEHHTWAGNVQRDPTLRLVRDYEQSKQIKNTMVRIAWRTWVPLLALMQHVVFWTYPWQLFRSDRLRGKRLGQCTLSVLLLVVSYTLLTLAAPAWLTWRHFVVALVIYLMVVELINFPHHLGTKLFRHSGHDHKLPLWQHHEVTRSCYYPAVLADFLLLNFNFHIEHHLFPDLPWFQLGRARQLTKAALGTDYSETKGIHWNLENRRKDATEVFLTDQHRGPTHWNLANGEAPPKKAQQ